MSGAAKNRGGLEIMNDILGITQEIAGSEDVDFIIASLDRRGFLMDEYDRVKAASPESIKKDRSNIDRVKVEIAKLDSGIGDNLQKLRAQAKQDLESSNTQKKVLGYANQAVSSSGSYMDFKK